MSNSAIPTEPTLRTSYNYIHRAFYRNRNDAKPKYGDGILNRAELREFVFDDGKRIEKLVDGTDFDFEGFLTFAEYWKLWLSKRDGE